MKRYFSYYASVGLDNGNFVTIQDHKIVNHKGSHLLGSFGIHAFAKEGSSFPLNSNTKIVKIGHGSNPGQGWCQLETDGQKSSTYYVGNGIDDFVADVKYEIGG